MEWGGVVLVAALGLVLLYFFAGPAVEWFEMNDTGCSLTIPMPFFAAWILMVLVGVCHAEMGWPPQTISYWISLIISLLLYLLVNAYRKVIA